MEALIRPKAQHVFACVNDLTVFVAQKLLGQLKFSQCFAQPVNMKKVKLDTCKVWVAQRLISILGVEDEVLTSLVFNHLEAEVCLSQSTR